MSAPALELADLRAMVRDLAADRIASRAAAIDAAGEFPQDVRALLAEHDILALPFDEAYGGTGTGTLMTVMAIEEIAKACASSALILTVHDLGTLPIRLDGADELKARVLPRHAAGEWVAAFALSEPDAGSDASVLRSRARRADGGWGISGSKNWITNARRGGRLRRLRGDRPGRAALARHDGVPGRGRRAS